MALKVLSDWRKYTYCVYIMSEHGGSSRRLLSFEMVMGERAEKEKRKQELLKCL